MLQRPRGTRDFAPEEMAKRQWALAAMRKVALSRGFGEIQMPIFEDLELFKKKSGPGIVEELYAFKDKGNREIALRPEMTAQVMRFYVGDMASLPKPLKLFYFGPCFRYENPQSGRYREFYQFGAEIIGSNTPETDAEAVALASSIIGSIGLKNYVIRIGFIGLLRSMLRESKLSEEKIAEALHYLDKNDESTFSKFARENNLPEDRISRIASVRKLKGGVEILEKLDKCDARDYLRNLMDCVSILGVERCTLDLGIVRGLDYYTGMVFEIDAPSLGAEKQVAGGGSYDLVQLFGGEQVFTTGFAIGFDRILLARENETSISINPCLDAYIIPMSDGSRRTALEIVKSLRDEGLSVDFDMMRRSLSKNLKYAAAIKAKNVIILGDKELANSSVTIRDMESGEQKEVKIGSIAKVLCAKK
jgi:histidyl-tRNA synthetase